MQNAVTQAQNPVLSLLSRDLYYDANDFDPARAENDRRRLDRIDRVRNLIRTSGCKKCKLFKERSGALNPVPGEGRGRIMLVGHRIGKQEANTGRPSIGDISLYNWTLLLKAIAPNLAIPDTMARDVCLDFVYTSNHSRCGADWHMNPPHKARKVCSAYWLKEEVIAVDPAIIVFWHRNSAGIVLNTAAKNLPRNGVVFEANVYGQRRPCMIMTHPATIPQKPTYQASVEAQYASLAAWLYEEGHLLQKSASYDDVARVADHRLVSTPGELEAMIEDLKNKAFIALDTETSYRGRYGHLTKHEKNKGALLWTRDGFEVVCAQLCALEPGGTVTRTYTVAFNFLDRAGNPIQALTPEQARGGIDRLLRHQVVCRDPRSGEYRKQMRSIFMWNAQFDCPVMTRLGVDLLGLSHRDYPVVVLDGSIFLARINEHLTDIGGMNLGSAAQMFIGETKESFNKSFDNPSQFRYADIRDPRVLSELLDYTGEDPRKTLLTSMRVLEASWKHVQEVTSVTSKERSSIPPCGFGPFPAVNATHRGSRLHDIAIPIEHQMVEVLSEMTMVGFRFASDQYKEMEVFVERQNMLLLKKLCDLGHEPRPNSDPVTLKRVYQLFEILTRGANDLLAAAQQCVQSQPGQYSSSDLFKKILKTFGVDITGQLPVDFRLTSEQLRSSYEAAYGELTAEQKVIEKFLDIYLDDTLLQLKTFLPDALPQPLSQELKRRAAAGETPFVDFDTTKEIFDTIFTYKRLNKIWSTYFKRFKELSDEYGIINPEYKGTSTTSGRLAGNFQNVPRGSDELKGILSDLDVRQYIYAVQPPDLNRLFKRMNLRHRDGRTWQVRGDDTYVLVTADYAAMEDRMAYAQTGDETKAQLLADPDLDTHFYNAAFLFGNLFEKELGVSLSSPEGLMKIYKHLKSDPDGKGYKDNYRTPVKTVHYASQYGAGWQKIHSLLFPIFRKQGLNWTEEMTKEIVGRYNDLYKGVVNSREGLIAELDTNPVIEYMLFGTLRHAENLNGNIRKGEHLSVANAMNQGTCAFLAKYAMIRLRHLIEANAKRWNLLQAGGDGYVGTVIQVHDEIGVLAPARLAEEVAEVLETAMKIIVGPPVPGKPAAFYDDTIEDSGKGIQGKKDTGWLYLSDERFKASVLMDAEAEIKRTIAKIDYVKETVEKSDGTTEEVKTLALLPDGQPNIYDLEQIREAFADTYIDDTYPLALGRAGNQVEVLQAA